MNAPPLQYLLESSQGRLKDFMISRLAEAANRRKEIKEILEEWAESRALALLSEWLLEYGAEIAALVVAPVEEKAEEKRIEKPARLKPFVYEHWRSERRHNRRRTG
jgi:hypothetical protein